MSSRKLDYFLVNDEIFYNNNLHKTSIVNHYCRHNENKEYIQKKIEEYSKLKNVFEQYDKGIKDINID